MLFGISAIAAYAQTSIPSSSVIPDPHVVFNSPDPPCTGTCYSVDLTYTGAPENGVIFSVPGPPGSFLVANPPAFTCDSNVFACAPDEIGNEFFAFSFFDGTLTSGETFTLSSDEPLDLSLPPGFTCNQPNACSTVDGMPVVNLTPEPGTAVLFLSGLISVVGFAKKRFGANART